VLFIVLPVSIASSISGGLIPVTVLITIAGARFLYKKKLV
jgi:hypothetical protein